jgi:hypothetical protein
MKFLLKITLGTSTFLICFVGIGILSDKYYDYKESKFKNVEIPKNLNLKKTIENFSGKQIDSLNTINENLIIVGSGLTGYEFYMWHKPIEKGEIYIKAYEITQNIQLSKSELKNETKNKIEKLSNKLMLYKGITSISEGTFNNFYPARFELWFKSESSGIETKITEKSYLIDGWDR